MIVLDASVLVNALGDHEEAGSSARVELRRADDFAAPDLIDVETMAALRRFWRAGSMSDEAFGTAVTRLERLEIERVPARRLMRRVFELRESVTAYDATYVALAEALGCELLTADRRLGAAHGPRCAIRVL